MLYEGVGREMSELDHDGEEDEGQSCVLRWLCHEEGGAQFAVEGLRIGVFYEGPWWFGSFAVCFFGTRSMLGFLAVILSGLSASCSWNCTVTCFSLIRRKVGIIYH